MLSADRRILLVLCYGQIVSWGSLYYAHAVLAGAMERDLGFSKTFLFGGFSLSLLVSGLISVHVARFLEARGGRLTMTIGNGLSAIGLALLGAVQSPALYLAAFTLLGLSSTMTLYSAAFATMVEIKGTAAKRSISILTVFGGLASTIFWPLTAFCESHIGWRGTWVLYAALILFTCAPLHYGLLPHRKQAAAMGGEQSLADPPPLLAPHLRKLAIFCLTIAFTGFSFVSTLLGTTFVSLFMAYGLGEAVIIGISSLRGVAQTGARLAELLWGGRMQPLHFAIGTSLLWPLAFTAFWITGAGEVGLIAFSLLLGIGLGLNTIVRSTLPLDLFGRRNYASLMAGIGRPGLIMAAAAPLAGGALVEHAGARITMALLFIITAIALASIAFLVLKAEFSAESRNAND